MATFLKILKIVTTHVSVCRPSNGRLSLTLLTRQMSQGNTEIVSQKTLVPDLTFMSTSLSSA